MSRQGLQGWLRAWCPSGGFFWAGMALQRGCFEQVCSGDLGSGDHLARFLGRVFSGESRSGTGTSTSTSASAATGTGGFSGDSGCFDRVFERGLKIRRRVMLGKSEGGQEVWAGSRNDDGSRHRREADLVAA